MTRRLAMSQKRLRGVPRHLRALDRWAESFKDGFPDLRPTVQRGERYYNWKLPVHASLVQGKHAPTAQRAKCAELMLKACAYLMAAKPEQWKKVRVTAVITQPDMFCSELCLYIDEAYFQSHVNAAPAEGRLSARWQLQIPANMQEVGIAFTVEGDDGEMFPVEHWYFGEVSNDFLN
ncbi:MAG TPA: DUF3916 domain-containing protein [Polaromonas sp.]|uniref:DUF3916 domain-containing protein n=1 Tax=Polaromonas sp. TaxID=1869339 RepID=UPI002D5FE754|nr:DUF3916 domain-containing protein [Polaromonas sp.]HYW57397.1 DUF3916 domain-containing protein [Polaromonas sp.]